MPSIGGTQNPYANDPSYQNIANNLGNNQYTANAQEMLADQQNNLSNMQGMLPYYQNQVQSQAQDSANSQINQAKSQIDKTSNQRGLLYSGLHDQAVQDSAANAAANAANNTFQGNMALDNMMNSYTNQAINTGLSNYQGQVGQSMSQYQNAINQQNMQNQMMGSMFGGLATAGAVGLLSDKRAKKDIKPAKGKLDVFVDKLEPSEYEYKDSSNGEGKHFGIMAQDLEKSDVGKSLVKETPKGKQVDIGKALGTVLALQSVINNRLKKVEKAS